MTEPAWFQRAGFDAQEFSANGIRTFAVVEGRRDQFPVIFLHGFPGGAFVWEYIFAALGRKRLAIAPDFPGWGRSVSRFGNDLPAPTPEWSLQWLKGVLDAQGVDRFDLVAHGNGAWLALELLSSDPARVRRLALITPRLWPHRKLALLGYHRKNWSAERVQKWLTVNGALRVEAAQRHERVFAELIDAKHQPTRLGKYAYVERIADYVAALRIHHGRSLLIWGERDPAYSLRESDELAAMLDQPEVHRLARSGHFPMLDEPQAVTQLIGEFLSE